MSAGSNPCQIFLKFSGFFVSHHRTRLSLPTVTDVKQHEVCKYSASGLLTRAQGVLFGSRKKLNFQIRTFLSQQQILVLALRLPFPPIFNFRHILLLKLYLFLPPFYLLEVPLRHPDFIRRLCCCGRKVVIWKFSIFLLTSKTKWAVVYSPEPLCLHSKDCCTDRLI